jgi:hypothetical protein
MAPPNLSTLERLPNELKLNIAEFMTPYTLASLVRVSKTLQPIAEEVLYRSVDILTPELGTDQYKPCYTSFFLRTMLQRPDLVQKVKSLKMHVSYRWAPVTMNTLYGVPLSASSVTPEIEITVKDTLLAGQLLAHLSVLASLALNFPWCLGGYHSLMIKFFGSKGDAVKRNLQSVPAFTNLTTLHWTCFYLPFCMACLPRLEALSISRDCLIEGPGESSEILRISSLTFERWVEATLPDGHFKAFEGVYGSGGPIFEFLERCIFLGKLSMILDANNFREYSHDRRGDMATFVDRLHDSIPALESLTIKLDDHTSERFLYFMAPVSSFKVFRKIKYLKLPQQMLFGADKGTLTPINELLPTSIKA